MNHQVHCIISQYVWNIVLIVVVLIYQSRKTVAGGQFTHSHNITEVTDCSYQQLITNN